LPVEVKVTKDVRNTNSTMRMIKMVPKIIRFTIIPSLPVDTIYDAYTIIVSKNDRSKED
jgi:hypothetical protein